MVKVSDMDEYLRADGVRDGEVVEVSGKARLVDAEQSVFERPYLELPVKLENGKHKIWTPNKTTLRNMAKAFGDDTDKWHGQRVKMQLVKQNVRGEMKLVIYGEPVEAGQAQQSAIGVRQ